MSDQQNWVGPAVQAFTAAVPGPAAPFLRGLRNYLTVPLPALHSVQWIPALQEVEIRLDLARKLRQNLRSYGLALHFEFTALELSALLLMPIESLRQLTSNTLAETRSFYYLTLAGIKDNLKYFLEGHHPHSKDLKRKTPGGGAESIEGTLGAKSVGRSEAEKQKCRQRDGNVCIFTGAAHPDVCHIVPFATSSTERNIELTNGRFANICSMFLPAADEEYTPVIGNGLGCSDKAWNMLCISTELHRYWAKPYWAVKFVGITPAEHVPKQRLTMRFEWLRIKNGDPSRTISVGDSTACHAMLAGLTTSSTGEEDACPCLGVEGIVAANCRRTNRPLASGQDFDVVLDTLGDALNMKKMLEIQWSLVTLAAMSGAAGPDDTGDDLSEFEFEREAYESANSAVYDDDR
ncbi:hypothetical protein CMQ_6627 [Grosmannia clavigera kw1407]|uniref:HNH nuclease domain-containing protein n=1 Tax=Grosmannia clavigera (strain kw1407 / UAMH 11150) TaxID=655863 RepID=F0X7P9_GROCL|nr:uncharacterized protein CMQ_6627 [Grosmannia clavigera kw1407]EFX06306.1 hypothetical protein CMQ_6627 [Grosmannia clavigera kw1407]